MTDNRPSSSKTNSILGYCRRQQDLKDFSPNDECFTKLLNLSNHNIILNPVKKSEIMRLEGLKTDLCRYQRQIKNGENVTTKTFQMCDETSSKICDMREEHRMKNQEYSSVKATTHLVGQLLDLAFLANDYTASEKWFMIKDAGKKLLENSKRFFERISCFNA